MAVFCRNPRKPSITWTAPLLTVMFPHNILLPPQSFSMYTGNKEKNKFFVQVVVSYNYAGTCWVRPC